MPDPSSTLFPSPCRLRWAVRSSYRRCFDQRLVQILGTLIVRIEIMIMASGDLDDPRRRRLGRRRARGIISGRIGRRSGSSGSRRRAFRALLAQRVGGGFPSIISSTSWLSMLVMWRSGRRMISLARAACLSLAFSSIGLGSSAGGKQALIACANSNQRTRPCTLPTRCWPIRSLSVNFPRA